MSLKRRYTIVIVFTILTLLLSTAMSFAEVMPNKDVGDYVLYEKETNNNISNANRIYNDYTVYGYLGEYDLDYFEFTVDCETNVQIVAVADKSTTFVTLNDSNNIIIKSEKVYYRNGSYGAVIAQSVSPGTYYIALVDSNSYNSYNAYGLYYIAKPVVSNHTHNYTYKSSVTEEPTCTTSGVTLNYCSCGEYESVTIPAKGHSFGDWRTEDGYLCTQPGKIIRTCYNCEEIESKYMPAKEHSFDSYITEDATCSEPGKEIAVCSNCGYNKVLITDTREHEYYFSATVYAGFKKEGKKIYPCAWHDCDSEIVKSIPALKSPSLSKTIYTFDNKLKKPIVTVKNTAGDIIKCKVSYDSGRKSVGQYAVKVKVTPNMTNGYYKGEKTVYFKIIPKGATNVKIVKGKKQFTVKWGKPNQTYRKQITGYQVRYATSSSKLSKAKPVTVKGNSVTSKTIKNLKAKKKYWVQVRTYKTVNGTKYYSNWSAKKTVTTK